MANAVQKAAPEGSVPAMITPAQMIKQAIESGSGVEVMERLLALQERYDAFNARKSFDDAMADLRKNLPKIVKSRTVDFESKNGGARTHYKFEDLAEITESLAGPMSDVGLSFRWYTENVDRGVKVTCRITHRDGHFEETSLVGPLDASGNKNPIQAIGSAVSYLQRYTLKAAVGVAASHDDDAQEVGRRNEPRQQAAPSVSKDEDARAVYTAAEHDIRKASSKDELRRVWGNIAWDAIPEDWKRDLVKEKDDRIAALNQPAPDGDDFPGDFDLNGHFDRMNDDAA